jgi:hypothetical protein
MSDIRMYTVEYEDSKVVVERVIFSDDHGIVLPARTHRIAVEACGRMALPFSAELRPGQQFVLQPVGQPYSVQYPPYEVQRVCKIPRAVFERAAAKTADPAALEELLHNELQ